MILIYKKLCLKLSFMGNILGQKLDYSNLTWSQTSTSLLGLASSSLSAITSNNKEKFVIKSNFIKIKL